MAHVNKDHAETIAALVNTPQDEQVGLFRFFQPKKGKNVFGWMEIVILGLRPFSTVEDKIIRRYVNLEPLCVNTFKKHTDALVKRVEEKIQTLLPDRFCLVFDGWSCGDTHFLAIFATFPSANELGYDRVLLTFSPMGDEKSLDAEEHVKFINETLVLYKKSIANVIAFVADNCATNKRTARLSGVPMVGCASHRFNLAVMQIVEENEEAVEKVRALMVILRQLIPAAKLRERTNLKAKLACPTRWGSYFKMLKRYMELKEFLSQLDLPSVEDALPTASDNRKLHEAMQKFEELQLISLSIQKNDTTLGMVRVFFDTVVEEFPQLANRLNADADIVHSKDFETGTVLIQQGKTSEMSSRERAAVASLREGTAGNTAVVGNGAPPKLSLLQRALKKRKISVGDSGRAYMDTRFVVPTSNMVESFFSRAGFALNDRRRGLLPVNLESQMFLFANASHWDVNDVSRVV